MTSIKRRTEDMLGLLADLTYALEVEEKEAVAAGDAATAVQKHDELKLYEDLRQVLARRYVQANEHSKWLAQRLAPFLRAAEVLSRAEAGEGNVRRVVDALVEWPKDREWPPTAEMLAAEELKVSDRTVRRWLVDAGTDYPEVARIASAVRQQQADTNRT